MSYIYEWVTVAESIQRLTVKTLVVLGLLQNVKGHNAETQRSFYKELIEKFNYSAAVANNGPNNINEVLYA